MIARTALATTGIAKLGVSQVASGGSPIEGIIAAFSFRLVSNRGRHSES